MLGVSAMPTTGSFSGMLPVLPQKPASPKSKTPPSEADEAVALAAVEVAAEAVVVGGGLAEMPCEFATVTSTQIGVRGVRRDDGDGGRGLRDDLAAAHRAEA